LVMRKQFIKIRKERLMKQMLYIIHIHLIILVGYFMTLLRSILKEILGNQRNGRILLKMRIYQLKHSLIISEKEMNT